LILRISTPDNSDLQNEKQDVRAEIILWQVQAVPTMVASDNLKLPILEDAWRFVLPSMPPLPQIGGPCW